MKLVIRENKPEKKDIIELYMSYDDGDVNIYANGELIAYIRPNGTAKAVTDGSSIKWDHKQ